MADPLGWKEREGYDIHLLRGGPASKALDNSLALDTSSTALPPTFSAHFKGAPSNLGVDVNQASGEVTAAIQPGSPQPQFPNFNFLMTATQVVGGVSTRETKIRMHVHESIQKIWLTPATLTIHVGSDECRFTVLALFDDGTVGDITDWTQLTYQSADPTAVSVLGPSGATETSAATTAGVLAAADAGRESVITVSLNLAAPPTNLSATAKVFTAPKWEEVGKTAKVQFVAGPLTPQADDMDPTHPGSAAAVIQGKVNILFVAEGFPAGKESVFRNDIVKKIVETELLKSGNLQPFKLLADSINYWSVFVESRDEAVSVLDDHEPLGSALERPAFEVPLARPPQSTGNVWTPLEMMHEGGLPLPSEPSASDPQAWATGRRKIYDIPAGAPANPRIEPADVGEWNDLKSRTLLNERDTVFGMAHYDRPRASGQDRAEGRLLPDMRRTGAKSIETFLENLKFGADAVTSRPYDIGENWVEDPSGAGGGKDFGLVCFVCQSGTRGGSWKVAVTQLLSRNIAFSTVGPGAGERVMVRAAANGTDVVPPAGTKIPAAILASQVAYGIGSAFGLQDENGDGAGGVRSSGVNVTGANLQLEVLMANTTAGTRTLDARKIPWLWPRIRNAGLVEVQLDPSGNVISPLTCDQSGNASPTGTFLLVRLLQKPSQPFNPGDAVRLRGALTRFGSSVSWNSSSSDPIASFPLSVETILGNGDVVLKPSTPPAQQLGYLPVAAGTVLDPPMFAQVVQCYLIAPRVVSGTENTLVAEPIFNWIVSTSSPLNAPANAQGALCAPAIFPVGDVIPTNLPVPLTLPKKLPSKADIIGLYDGGAGFDCGVFRSAGRCRMRRGHDATTPFCHVCRYVIVDHVNPAKHRKLDDFYEIRYPKP